LHRLVDGMNLIGSRPDGWWRDRAAARRGLVARLGAFAVRTGEEVTVVFDGRPGAGEGTGDDPVEVVFAPGGPDAADRVIAELAAAAEDRSGIDVVTSDRALADQVRRLGATVTGVGAFARMLDEPAG